MKKIFFSISMIGAVAFFSSCGNEEHTETNSSKEVANQEEKTETCTFSIDPSTVQLAWTSYKHNEKTPVGGVFDMLELNNTVVAEKPEETFQKATISINTRTVNSDNEVRDEKIKNSFFGTMSQTDFLTGKIVAIEGEGNGTAVIAIAMNGVEKEQDFKWKIEEGKVEFKTELNVEDWNAKPSLDSLNLVCEDLHKGADGVSKLWSTVEVNITAEINKECK
ncbi:MAG: YceI family protein [Flavobacteriales bacterium]|jgi:polyisoprenoid-binding protein YceI|nr:YceI family protein [Flavobacteriales bacterium]